MKREVTITLEGASWIEDEQDEFEDLMGKIRYALKYSPFEWKVEDGEL